MTELKQADNKFAIEGKLKTNGLEYGTDKNGTAIIKGYVVVEVPENENKVGQGNDTKIHNHRIDVYAKELTKKGKTNGAYKGLNTVMREFKDIDSNGEELADLVHVQGNVDYNIYKSNNTGEVHENNRLRTMSISRVKNVNKYKPSAKANVDIVILGSTPEVINDEPTGFQNIKAVTVGYGGKAINLVGLKAWTDGEDFDSFIPDNSTVAATLVFNNYAVVKKETKETKSLFGQSEKVVETNSYKKFIKLQGADEPFKEYSDEEILQLRTSLQEQYNEAIAKADEPSHKSNKNLFEDKSNQIEISDDDVPF